MWTKREREKKNIKYVNEEAFVKSESSTQTETENETYHPMIMQNNDYISKFPPEVRNNPEIVSLFVSLPNEYRDKLISINEIILYKKYRRYVFKICK